MMFDRDEINLVITPKMLVVFIDETGVEDFSDSKFPIFGRGYCAVVGGNGYKNHIKKPWCQLKRNFLGGANQQFHATDFEQSKPTKRQIGAINQFMLNPFIRDFRIVNNSTDKPENMDWHAVVSYALLQSIQERAKKWILIR